MLFCAPDIAFGGNRTCMSLFHCYLKFTYAHVWFRCLKREKMAHVQRLSTWKKERANKATHSRQLLRPFIINANNRNK